MPAWDHCHGDFFSKAFVEKNPLWLWLTLLLVMKESHARCHLDLRGLLQAYEQWEAVVGIGAVKREGKE